MATAPEMPGFPRPDMRFGIASVRLTLALPGLLLSAAVAAQSVPARQGDAGTAVQTLDAVSVSAPRRPPGAALGDLRPEVQLGPEEVQSYGVSTMDELLSAIAPLTVSGAGEESPVVLLNGLRISGMAEIRDIPTEAIRRIDVLPEEQSLLYGHAPNQKVVNVVLLPQFSATTAELDGSRPTRGGQESGSAKANRFAVELDNRINLALAYSANTALNAAERDYAPVPIWPPYDVRGNVVAARAGQEIDPALSALAGSPAIIAGVPSGLDGRVATLEDFAATAGQANVADDRPDRTLAAANHALTANAVWSRALGNATSATLNFNSRINASDSLRGLAAVGLVVPRGNPFSPFAADVVVDRYVPVVLHQSSKGWSSELNGTLNHDADRWHLSITGSYSHGYSRTVTDAGIDNQPTQSLLANLSPGFDPFGPLDAALFPRRAANIAESASDSANIQAVVNGTVLNLPAGSLVGSFRIGDSGSRISSHAQGADAMWQARLSRNDASAQGSFDLPLTSRAVGVFPAAGDIAFNGHAAIDAISGFGALARWGYGARWSPIKAVTLSVNVDSEQSAPSPQQLGDPRITTTGARLFDFATGKTTSVTVIRGGNANLEASQQRRFRAGLTVKPFQGRQLSFVANYADSKVTNPVRSLPPATAALQAVLADRFITDEDGNLTTVDYRPLNFAAETHRQLRWGVNDSRPVADWFGTGPTGALAHGAGRLVVSLYDTIVFEDRVLVRQGAPLLDLLNGGAVGTRGGQARHQIDGDIGYAQDSFGIHLDFAWRSGTTLRGGADPAEDLDFSSLATLNLRVFVNLDQMAIAKQRRWLDGARITFSVGNLLDRRVQVTDGDGATPPNYQSVLLDPIGRQLSLNVRKRFL